MAELPASFWEQENRRLLMVLKPRLIQAASTASKRAALKAGIVFDLTLANQQAADWASQYTDDLLTQLGGTTVDGVGSAISSFVSGNMNMGNLLNALDPILGRDRASRIAVTETTRAFAEGEFLQYTAAGVKRWRWNTNADGIVCDICAPLNGQVVTIGEPFGYTKKGDPIIKPPDAHPGDRCWVSPVVDEQGAADILLSV